MSVLLAAIKEIKFITIRYRHYGDGQSKKRPEGLARDDDSPLWLSFLIDDRLAKWNSAVVENGTEGEKAARTQVNRNPYSTPIDETDQIAAKRRWCTRSTSRRRTTTSLWSPSTTAARRRAKGVLTVTLTGRDGKLEDTERRRATAGDGEVERDTVPVLEDRRWSAVARCRYPIFARFRREFVECDVFVERPPSRGGRRTTVDAGRPSARGNRDDWPFRLPNHLGVALFVDTI